LDRTSANGAMARALGRSLSMAKGAVTRRVSRGKGNDNQLSSSTPNQIEATLINAEVESGATMNALLDQAAEITASEDTTLATTAEATSQAPAEEGMQHGSTTSTADAEWDARCTRKYERYAEVVLAPSLHAADTAASIVLPDEDAAGPAEAGHTAEKASPAKRAAPEGIGASRPAARVEAPGFDKCKLARGVLAALPMVVMALIWAALVCWVVGRKPAAAPEAELAVHLTSSRAAILSFQLPKFVLT